MCWVLMAAWGAYPRVTSGPHVYISHDARAARLFSRAVKLFGDSGCHLLVVAVGTGTTPRHNGAGYALRSGFGLHNGVIQGEAGQNSLRTVEPAP